MKEVPVKTMRHHLAECPQGADLVRNIEPVVFDFVVLRTGGFSRGFAPEHNCRVIISFDPENAPSKRLVVQLDVLHRIREGIEKWVKATDGGRHVYNQAGDDMNFGDLLSYDGCDEIVPFIKGCIEFRLEVLNISTDLTYDTTLCDYIESLSEVVTD